MMTRIDKDGTWIFIEYYKILQEDYEKVRKENERLKELLEIAPTHIRRKLKELEEN